MISVKMVTRSLFFLLVFSSVSFSKLNTSLKNSTKLSPCSACKVLVESFKKGIQRTARGNFAGGDSAWEEEKLGSYLRSEVRLVEIQENLCHDVTDTQAQCHSLAEEAEADLETWWFHKQYSDPDLERWLCFSQMKLCCPPGHYGPDCSKCPGYPGAVCSDNGKCKGDGTRSGTGECVCDVGYVGPQCKECAVDHFQLSSGSDASCSPCHKSCLGGCSGGTSAECKACKPGWEMDEGKGCLDIDECRSSRDLCQPHEVCINSEGSYFCDDAFHQGMKDPGKWVRYMTYGSFILASALFIRKSTRIGSFVALVTAIYISVSEIVMNDFIDMSKLDFLKR